MTLCHLVVSVTDIVFNQGALFVVLQESDISAEARVCSACRCRVVRRRYVQCPLPTCPTAKRRVKRLRPLPNKWNELSPDVRTALESEFQVCIVVFRIDLEEFDFIWPSLICYRSDLI